MSRTRVIVNVRIYRFDNKVYTWQKVGGLSGGSTLDEKIYYLYNGDKLYELSREACRRAGIEAPFV